MTSGRLSLRQSEAGSTDVLCDGHLLMTYVYDAPIDPYESPKPYLHPVRTLAGEVVTAYRPEDHVWHKGIQMTAHLSGQNFWGGATYVHGRGYVDLPNNGRMEHVGWDEVAADGGEVCLAERLVWRTAADERWIDEQRLVKLTRVEPAAGWYRLSFGFSLRNVSGRELAFTSPATEGLPGSGYGGLFWRGPRSFVDGRVLADAGLAGPDVMGKRSPWLAYVGRHDGHDRVSTLVFIDHPDNPRYPNEWFVRSTPFPCVCFPLAFLERLPFEPDAELPLRYGVIVADGELDRSDIDALVKEV